MSPDCVRARQLCPEAVSLIGQQLGDGAKPVFPLGPALAVGVQLDPLESPTELYRVPAGHPIHIVADLVGVEDVLIPGECARASGKVRQAAHLHASDDAPSGHELQRRIICSRQLGGSFAINSVGAQESEPKGIQKVCREDVCFLQRRRLISRLTVLQS